MAIDTNLLISAAMLQDYFVDNATGLPMANGTISMYQDNSRTTYKNWYYQTGTPGNYTYITLPNPLTLSAVGTITDANGNDTIPFYYPYSESPSDPPGTPQPYYVVVVDSNGQQQFTRQNFPFNPVAGPEPATAANLKNYITNNVFWRNIGSIALTTPTNTTTINGNTYYNNTLAPSQHDGFTMPDIQFFKNATGAVDTVAFNAFVTGTGGFADQIIPNDITPEYYLNFQCTGTGSETKKYIQVPLQLHVKSLSGVPKCTFVLDAMAVTGSPTITVSIWQFLGTGVTSPTPSVISSIVLTNSWESYQLTFDMPSAQNLTLGVGGDDALYMQINLPTSTQGVCNINLAKPSFYLSSETPDNDFRTYDEVSAITNSPRTGDIRTSLNSFAPFGWVLCNDGVISNANNAIVLPSNIPAARANADTWPLFNLLWNAFKTVDTGSNSNPIAQMFTSLGAATNYGATAYADFSANNQMQLSLILGRALIAAPPAMSVTYTYNSAPSWNSGVNGFFTAISTTLLYVGAPVYLTGTMPLSGNFTANIVYYAIPAIDGSSTTTFQLASTYANAIAGTAIAAGSASNNGSSIVVNFALGDAFGEPRHVQLTKEVGQHLHTLTPYTATTAGSGSSVQAFLSSGSISTNNNSPAGYPFNIVQPSTYMNVFLKL